MIVKNGSLKIWSPKRSVLAAIVAALLSAMLLAGCVSEDDVLTPEAPEPVGVPVDAETGQPKRYRFSADAPTDSAIQATGAFAISDYCFPAACAAGGSYEEVIDLTGLLPVGVPVRIDLQLTNDHEIMGNIAGEFVSEGVVFLHAAQWGPYGELNQLAVVVRPAVADTLHFVVRAQFPDAAPERTWHLAGTARSAPDTLSPGVPTLLEVKDTSAPPRFNGTDGDADIQVLLWGPDDAFLGRFSSTEAAEEAIRAVRRGGGFVVLVPLEAAPVSVLWNGTGEPPALRALALTREIGDLHAPMVHEEAAAWSFDLARVPVAVGIAILTSETHYVAARFSASIQAGGGNVLGIEYECGLCMSALSTGTFFEASTPPGAAGVGLGTYEATFVVDGDGLKAAHFVVHYAR